MGYEQLSARQKQSYAINPNVSKTYKAAVEQVRAAPRGTVISTARGVVKPEAIDIRTRPATQTETRKLAEKYASTLDIAQGRQLLSQEGYGWQQQTNVLQAAQKQISTQGGQGGMVLPGLALGIGQAIGGLDFGGLAAGIGGALGIKGLGRKKRGRHRHGANYWYNKAMAEKWKNQYYKYKYGHGMK